MLIKVPRFGEVTGVAVVWRRARLAVPWGTHPAVMEEALRQGIKQWVEHEESRGHRLVSKRFYPEYYDQPDAQGNQLVRIHAQFRVPVSTQKMAVDEKTALDLTARFPNKYKLLE